MRSKLTGNNYLEGVFDADLGALASIGKIPFCSPVTLAGLRKNLSNAATETIWAQGGDYVWMEESTQLYVSLSSSSDVGNTVIMSGLDSNYDPIVVTATLNGQNQVAFSAPVLFNDACRIASGEIIHGDIYIAESDTLTAGVPNTASKIKDKIALTGSNAGTIYGSYKITHKAAYVVPKGKTALLTGFIVSSSTNDKIQELGGWIKLPNGAPWIQRSPIYSGENSTYLAFPNRPAIPEKSCIEFRAKSSTGGSHSVGVQAQFWLFDN